MNQIYFHGSRKFKYRHTRYFCFSKFPNIDMNCFTEKITPSRSHIMQFFVHVVLQERNVTLPFAAVLLYHCRKYDIQEPLLHHIRRLIKMIDQHRKQTNTMSFQVDDDS